MGVKFRLADEKQLPGLMCRILCPAVQVSRVIKPGQVTPNGVKLPVAEPGTERQYYFYDRVHPSGGCLLQQVLLLLLPLLLLLLLLLPPHLLLLRLLALP